ncbi:Methylmalonyl-CoA epimerase [Geobacillus stearothermophilus]|uniref:Methylmalonyl-CoA epimerase n=1 Tax=Geobacillus stearothermophilus TaxID=1422 RepID=A0ABQ7HCJ4_GEOSE|nr:Methylmalonyl-CoA epimerase [Geobacillus stearothermophilus]KOR93812.1 hypothetical protein N231_10510 [Geobacillus stearothermophilus ATCC 12980]KMY59318.1 hypothetical protein AA906_08890 [Geobacillus stearothermophilus]KMY60087.1 hypothetical protein AA905_10900 [Geobacillus stearothermophilus]KMY60811.1 hypothetical protein AA904_08550 [Geobacillus stearothermophilus]
MKRTAPWLDRCADKEKQKKQDFLSKRRIIKRWPHHFAAKGLQTMHVKKVDHIGIAVRSI